MRLSYLLAGKVLLLSSCIVEAPAPPPQSAVAVFPSVETTPVNSSGDAADDPTIWINTSAPENSLIIGTDKKYGIEVYRLNGERVQSLGVGRTNNVDLRLLSNDENWSAIAAASNRSTNTISLFAVDHDGRFYWLEESEIDTGLNEPYGICMSAGNPDLQIFVNGTDGRYQQWGLRRDRMSPTQDELPNFSARLLREFSVSSQPEGCVVDDDEQRLFIGIETEGVRYVSAMPGAEPQILPIADIDGEILVADVEGMTIYHQGEAGYLVVSSQGNNSFAVYDKLPPFDYRGSFVISAASESSLDGAQDTDGLAVSSQLRTAEFPQGLLVVQDGFNTEPQAAQNFKYVSWQEIAQSLGL